MAPRDDRVHYSGIPWYMLHALEAIERRGAIELAFIGPIEDDARAARRLRLRNAVEMRLGRHPTRPVFHPPMTRAHERVARHLLAGRRLDVLLGNWSWMARLADVAPVVLLRDATPAGLAELPGYEYFRAMSRTSQNWGRSMEERAARDCLVQFFTSEWAADGASAHYGAPRERLALAPFGANIEHPPAREQVHGWIEARVRGECRLLLVGREWERKGGPYAVEIVQALRRAGVPAVLDVAGVGPQDVGSAGDCVRFHGLLRKDVPGENARLEALLRECHFLCVPSRGECFGIVYAEASAFGLPSVARRVGGVAAAVGPDNGILLDPEAPAAEAAAAVGALFADARRYAELAHSARRCFEQRLNWDVTARTILGEVARRLGRELPAMD